MPDEETETADRLANPGTLGPDRVDWAAVRMNALASAAAGVVRAATEDELFDVLRDSCARVIPFDAVMFGLYRPDQDALDFLEADDQGEPVATVVVRIEGTPAETVIRERRSLLTLRSDDARASGARTVGSGRRSESIIRCPVLGDGEVLGMISVQSYRPDAYDAADVEVVEILAANAATALLNLRYRRDLAETIEQEREARHALRVSEERHRALLEHSHDLTVVMDRDGVLTFVSPSSRRILGYDPEAMLGRGILEFVRTGEGDLAPDTFMQWVEGILVEGARPIQFLHADGGWRMLALVGSDLLDHPAVDGVVFNARDVTERYAAERRGEEALRRLRAAQAMANVGDWEYDVTAGTVTCSDELYRIYGIPRDEPVDFQTFLDLVHPDDLEAVTSVTAEARERGGWYYVNHRIVRPDGTVRHVHGRGLFVVDPDGSLLRVFGTSQDVTELREAEQALRSSQERLRLFLRQIPAVLWMTDADLNVTWADGAGLTTLGQISREPIGQPLEHYVGSETAARRLIPMHRRALNGGAVSRDLDWQGRTFEARVEPLRDERGGVLGTLGFALDVTDRKLLERQLRGAQRMEAIGRLAGGVAHDFNNLLTVIDGHANLLLDETQEGEPLRRDIQQVRQAAARATALTRQLLAFSRRQFLKPQAVDVNEAVVEMQQLLHRLIGEDIRLHIDLAPEVGLVEVDPSQFEQVLMNLAVNARDAMPDGGTLTVTTRDATIDAAMAGQFSFQVEPGDYVRIDVTDTGQGMRPDVAQRAFEPFFTTKSEGEGTGLGLATVYGIVKQSRGYIWVHSEPDVGTRFEIYLPRVERSGLAPAGREEEHDAIGGTETILLVEDEDAVRSLARRVLQRKGYRVLEARNGVEALQTCEEHGGVIDLILTDVVMPSMSGTELVQRLRSITDLRPLFMSGYTEDEVFRRGIGTDEVPFLEKPFTPDSLARKVREVLDAPGSDPSA